jgi:hypothetical protein
MSRERRALVNQGGQDHGHGHHEHHGQEKPRRQFHKDWRVWIGVVLILAAMAVYVLTNDETLRPGRRLQQPVPAAPGP